MPKIIIPDVVVDATSVLLLSYSDKRDLHEGIVYWAGYRDTDFCIITSVIAPKADTSSGRFTVGVVENADVIREVSERGLRIIAQVHSHPFSCGINHSPGDDEMAFMPFEGLISIVIADYAIGGLEPLSEQGFHLFRNGKFFRVPAEQIREKTVIVPWSSIPIKVDLR